MSLFAACPRVAAVTKRVRATIATFFSTLFIALNASSFLGIVV